MADKSKEELLKLLLIELLWMRVYLSKMSDLGFKEDENGV